MASLILAGCGGSSDKTSTAAGTTANTSTPSVTSHLLTNNELNGFKGHQPLVGNTVKAWVAATDTPSDQVTSATKRLTSLGFVAGAHEDLDGPSGRQGVSIVEQFKTPAGARSELANEVKVIAHAQGPETFPVTGIPGAVGLAVRGGSGVNVAFASGDYYYLVGAFVPKVNASSEATLIAAAKRLYQRVHD